MNNLPEEIIIDNETEGFDYISLGNTITDYCIEKYGVIPTHLGYEVDIKVTVYEWDIDDEESEEE